MNVFRDGDAVRVKNMPGVSYGRVVNADRTRPDAVYKVAAEIDRGSALNYAERKTGIRLVNVEAHQMEPA